MPVYVRSHEISCSKNYICATQVLQNNWRGEFDYGCVRPPHCEIMVTRCYIAPCLVFNRSARNHQPRPNLFLISERILSIE